MARFCKQKENKDNFKNLDFLTNCMLPAIFVIFLYVFLNWLLTNFRKIRSTLNLSKNYDVKFI
jgi:hypothetical protein